MAEVPTVIVLASASPRRRELMIDLLAGSPQDLVIDSESVDEASVAAGATPQASVVAVAEAKLAAVIGRRETGETVVAADTMVIAATGEVMGKPADAIDATRMMQLMSDTAIQVVTGVVTATVAGADAPAGPVATESVTTTVHLAAITDADIASYLQTDIPWDKAGALELQGASAHLVTEVDGCWSNVIGLPTCTVAAHLGLELSGPTCRSWSGAACPRLPRH